MDGPTVELLRFTSVAIVTFTVLMLIVASVVDPVMSVVLMLLMLGCFLHAIVRYANGVG